VVPVWGPAGIARRRSLAASSTASGGWYSTMFVRPSYQHGVRNVVGRWRGIPDSSMSASCADPVKRPGHPRKPAKDKHEKKQPVR
jgi:subtilase family serine protease